MKKCSSTAHSGMFRALCLLLAVLMLCGMFWAGTAVSASAEEPAAETQYGYKTVSQTGDYVHFDVSGIMPKDAELKMGFVGQDYFDYVLATLGKSSLAENEFLYIYDLSLVSPTVESVRPADEYAVQFYLNEANISVDNMGVIPVASYNDFLAAQAAAEAEKAEQETAAPAEEAPAEEAPTEEAPAVDADADTAEAVTAPAEENAPVEAPAAAETEAPAAPAEAETVAPAETVTAPQQHVDNVLAEADSMFDNAMNSNILGLDDANAPAEYSYEVEVGNSEEITGSNGSNIYPNHRWTISEGDGFVEISAKGNIVTVKGLSEGTAKIEHKYNWGFREITDTYTITVYKPLTITFNANGGTVAPTTAQVKKNAPFTIVSKTTTVTAPSETQKLGGWRNEATGETVLPTVSISVSEDTTFTAQWIDKIAVSFDPQNGEAVFTAYEDDNGKVVFPAAPKAPATKSFKGWNTASDGSGTTYQPGTSTVVAVEGTTYYAQWGDASYNNKNVVSVYVAALDKDGNPFSQEMLDLLGIKYVNSANYFPAGTVRLPDECFTDSVGNDGWLADTDEKWNYIIQALQNGINTSVLSNVSDDNGRPSDNAGHKLAEYADRVIRDLNKENGNQWSTLFYSTANQSITTSCTHHLDLRFSCNRITFMTGHNNISGTGTNADDNSVIDTRVYITGSIIQEPTGGVTPPAGYKVLPGYYSDYECTQLIPDNELIGTPLDKDRTVYVKIVPQNDVVITYKVAEGQGTVDVAHNIVPAGQEDAENFNPETGNPIGATAAAAAGWKFVGWYADEACEQLVSIDEHYTPTAPATGWPEGAEDTYYAKFEHIAVKLTINKEFVDLAEADWPNEISVNVIGLDVNNHQIPEVILNRDNGYSYTVENLRPNYTYDVMEQLESAQVENYNLTVSYDPEDIQNGVASGRITTSSDVNTPNVVTITNTYEPQTVTLTVTKNVSGNFGDKAKTFNIDVAVDGRIVTSEQNSNAYTDQIKHTYEIPYGKDVVIKETNADGYTMTSSLGTVDKDNFTCTVSGENTKEDLEVVITNTKNITPDTGINLDSLPYIIVLAVVVAGAVIVVVRKHRRSYDD